MLGFAIAQRQPMHFGNNRRTGAVGSPSGEQQRLNNVYFVA